MAAHIRHVTSTVVLSTNDVFRVSLSELMSELDIVRTSTNRMNVRDSLHALSQEAVKDEDVRRSLKDKDNTTVCRRIQKALNMLVGVLFADLNGSSLPTLGSYQRKGESILRTWDFSLCICPMNFIRACKSLPTVIQELPVMSLFPFLIHAVLYEREEAHLAMEHTVTIFRRCQPFRTSLEFERCTELIMELFIAWERIFPARYVYDPNNLERTELAWNTEITGSGLAVPNLDEADAVFEEFMEWIPLAMKLTRAPLPHFLRETARIYYHCQLTCVDVDQEAARVEPASFISYTGQGYDKVQIRDSHLQTLIACIWKNVGPLAKQVNETAEGPCRAEFESFDDYLVKCMSSLMMNISIVSLAVAEGGKNFKNLLPQMWLSLCLNQNAKDISDSCKTCENIDRMNPLHEEESTCESYDVSIERNTFHF